MNYIFNYDDISNAKIGEDSRVRASYRNSPQVGGFVVLIRIQSIDPIGDGHIKTFFAESVRHPDIFIEGSINTETREASGRSVGD